MPKQHMIFGRPLPRIGARRISFLLVSISIFAVFSLIFTLPSAIPAGPSLSKYTDHKFSIPSALKNPFGASSRLNPFKSPSHPPPRQQNDTYGESSWWADWKWLSVPFSSSLTLDEERSLLPPLKPRSAIYCYYDTTIKKDAASKDAESELLLLWRRAWWARGFKPIILSAAEAMKNPLYDELQRKEMDAELKTDLMRWLAWDNMRGGLLAYHTTLPMGSHEDPLLSYLRRGEYPELTRWNNLNNGLFAGGEKEVTNAIKATMAGSKLKEAKDFIAAATEDTFKIDNYPKAIAYYDVAVIQDKYPKVGEAIAADRAGGLKALKNLINGHLHTTWQNVFSDGIAVLKPLPQHMTNLIKNAWDLAGDLSMCPDSPMPSSCPPNNPKCKPCVPAQPMHVSTPPRYRNTSTLYTIGTVPHPYTTALLANLQDTIEIPWLRRKSERDAWLGAVTTELLGVGIGSAPRVLKFKEAVAGEFATAHSLWLTAEKDLPKDLDWHFGFAIPHNATDGTSQTPVPGPERRPQPKHDPADGPIPTAEELDKEKPLLKRARDMGKTKDARELSIRGAVEAWNLADTESWKFARAFLARRIVERKEWEENESQYVGGVGTEKGRRTSWGDRWMDKDKKQ
ncbi:uncharacterized protein CCOS01_03240 [Colletotrichum costaricense]|uniref:Uncharacterized protein n=1 Tax=Colletotrichum costaricense TaxID=1209916 RepID=A0AAJ0E5J6_9PEZI|nr:uncharacterized protein CCOS01_03240 [Colletotrichum costaricense]KAK1534488.1 hypothetical protein CCOS01_03240 [Colletotrichum costaricense]